MQSHSLFNFIDSLFLFITYYDGTLAYLIIQYILVNLDYMSGVLWSAKNIKEKHTKKYNPVWQGAHSQMWHKNKVDN